MGRFSRVTSEVRHLFVYGTLRPGDVRWRFLQPFVVDEGWPDTIEGRLFDTGLDYPAAILDERAEPGGTIIGHGVIKRRWIEEEGEPNKRTTDNSGASPLRV